jgi:hypothetical protein
MRLYVAHVMCAVCELIITYRVIRSATTSIEIVARTQCTRVDSINSMAGVFWAEERKCMWCSMMMQQHDNCMLRSPVKLRHV